MEGLVIWRSAITAIGIGMLIFPAAHQAAAAEFKREISTDRPDKTESPYTVEAGHVQFELNLMSFSFDDSSPTDSTELKVRRASMGGIAKYGLAHNIDLQLMVGFGGVSSWIEGPGTGLETSKFPRFEFSDPGLRLKINLRGNDSGKTAIGLMPYVILPLGSEAETADTWQGGIIVPAAVELGERSGCGLMLELDAVSDEVGDGHHLELVSSATVSYDVSSAIGVFVELFQQVDLRGGSPWSPTFDSGVTIAASDNVQIDFGANLGLNAYAEDFNPFVGVSLRF